MPAGHGPLPMLESMLAISGLDIIDCAIFMKAGLFILREGVRRAKRILSLGAAHLLCHIHEGRILEHVGCKWERASQPTHSEIDSQ